jgi:hypothetical protein
MILHRFNNEVPRPMGRILADFEREFSYPLGPSQRFRISHGEDYLPFFQAIGETTLLAMESRGKIIGGIARVRRELEQRIETGTVAGMLEAHYLCDLKVTAAARGTAVLARLIRETKQDIEASESTACYCIVMEGTGRLPTDYTGRLGVPRFEMMGEIVIVRISRNRTKTRECRVVDGERFQSIRSRLAGAGYTVTGGESALRSQRPPMHLVTEGGDACGVLEDTQRAKRLFLESGGELCSAHLSGFAYETREAGANLLGEAAKQAGCPLFVALPLKEMTAMRPMLDHLEITEAGAAVYGHGFEKGRNWWVDTAEI